MNDSPPLARRSLEHNNTQTVLVNPPITDAIPSHIGNLVLSIDLGTTYCKMSRMLSRDRDFAEFKILHTLPLLSRVRGVKWAKEYSCPTKLAPHLKADGVEWLFGEEVCAAIRDEDIKETDVLDCFKFHLFGCPKGDSSDFDGDRLLGRLQNLKDRRLVDHSVTVRDLVIDLLGRSYAWALETVKKQDSSLVGELPEFQQADLIQWVGKTPGGLRVQVCLPIPASATLEERQNMLEIASEAGIPNCELVDEPLAAITKNMQQRFEQSESDVPRREQTIAIIDTGGGTMEVVVVRFVPQGESWVLHELVPGRSEWTAGVAVNKRASKNFDLVDPVGANNPGLFERIRVELEKKGVFWTRDELVAKFEAEFEQRKHEFGKVSKRETVLNIEGWPEMNRPDITITNRKVKLSREFMQNAFELVISATWTMVKQVMEQLRKKDLTLDTIMLTGGFHDNWYVRDQLQAHLKEAVGTPVEIVGSSDEFAMDTAVGATLLSMDDDFVGDKVLRQGLLIRCDMRYDRTTFPRLPKGALYYDRTDRSYRVYNRSLVLVPHGSVIGKNFEMRASDKYHKNYLIIEWYTDDDQGLVLEPELYTVKNPKYCRDGLDVDSLHNDGKLKVVKMFSINDLTPEQLAAMPTKTEPQSGRSVSWFEWDVCIGRVKSMMRFSILIPLTGQFDGCPEDKILHKEVMFNASIICQDIALSRADRNGRNANTASTS